MELKTNGTAADQLARVTQLEYLLIGDLRDLLDDRPDSTDRKWLMAVLDALLQSLNTERELKDEGGYFQKVVDKRPAWSRLVERLREENLQMYDRLFELRIMMDLMSDRQFEKAITHLRGELMKWMMWFTAHSSREERLLQTAFLVAV